VSVSGWCVHNLLCVAQGVCHGAVDALLADAFLDDGATLLDNFERCGNSYCLVHVVLWDVLSCNLAGVVHGGGQGCIVGFAELVDEQHVCRGLS